MKIFPVLCMGSLTWGQACVSLREKDELYKSATIINDILLILVTVYVMIKGRTLYRASLNSIIGIRWKVSNSLW